MPNYGDNIKIRLTNFKIKMNIFHTFVNGDNINIRASKIREFEILIPASRFLILNEENQFWNLFRKIKNFNKKY